MTKVEVCAYSLESCIAAQKGNANRIELCAGLYEGGTTPSFGLISQVRKQVDIDLFVMIRPRGGDFLYSHTELETMKADIDFVKKTGANGIVLGLLKKNGEVDLQKTKELVALAHPLKVTFHRAIDVAIEPIEAMEAIIEAGCERILTSGQKNKAFDGLTTIGQLVEKAQNRIEIMAGSGVNAENAKYFLQKGVNALHLTGRSMRSSAMEYRKSDVSMCDLGGVPEFEIAFSDFTKINEVVEIVKKYKP